MFLALDHKETGKTGLEMASGVMSVLVSTKSTETLRAAGFDSTSSNTGYIKGACAHLENQLERPLQRVVCQMHFAELPARHLFYHFYGKPNGPIGPGGEFGNMLNTLNENLLPFVEYQTIQSNVPVVPRELFRDKQDLLVFYDLIRAVENGREHVDPAYLTKKLPAQSTVR